MSDKQEIDQFVESYKKLKTEIHKVIVGQEEVVIKPLGKSLQGTPGMAGATITSDGKIALILDIPSLLKHYVR